MSLANPTQDIIVTQFHLPTETIKLCDKYFILYWQARYTYSQLFRDSRIIKDGVSYIPVMQQNLTLSWIGKNPEAQVKLSFRKLRGHRAGYVLIAPVASVCYNSPAKASI